MSGTAGLIVEDELPTGSCTGWMELGVIRGSDPASASFESGSRFE